MEQQYPKNGFRVCVDKVENDVEGRIYSPLFKDKKPFSSFAEVILVMDNVFDATGYPHAFQESRSFVERRGTKPYQPKKQEEIPRRRVEDQKGKVYTVDIVVLERRGSSWQGVARNTNTGEEKEFHSEMELFEMVRKELDQ